MLLLLASFSASEGLLLLADYRFEVWHLIWSDFQQLDQTLTRIIALVIIGAVLAIIEIRVTQPDDCPVRKLKVTNVIVRILDPDFVDDFIAPNT